MTHQVRPRPRRTARTTGRDIDPNCPFKGFCGDPIDGRLCDTCMTPEERGPAPVFRQRRITQECRPCAACGGEFVPEDRSKGVRGDLAWVTGEQHAGYKRFHEHCLPDSAITAAE